MLKIWNKIVYWLKLHRRWYKFKDFENFCSNKSISSNNSNGLSHAKFALPHPEHLTLRHFWTLHLSSLNCQEFGPECLWFYQVPTRPYVKFLPDPDQNPTSFRKETFCLGVGEWSLRHHHHHHHHHGFRSVAHYILLQGLWDLVGGCVSQTNPFTFWMDLDFGHFPVGYFVET